MHSARETMLALRSKLECPTIVQAASKRHRKPTRRPSTLREKTPSVPLVLRVNLPAKEQGNRHPPPMARARWAKASQAPSHTGSTRNRGGQAQQQNLP
mmetsp:Transcript_16859/g.40155  ORF Transcript_16859/g.40155 Transcript_16859/m.40155 type:complete len:98 (+) Transcript_16859:597-890(+)